MSQLRQPCAAQQDGRVSRDAGPGGQGPESPPRPPFQPRLPPPRPRSPDRTSPLSLRPSPTCLGLSRTRREWSKQHVFYVLLEIPFKSRVQLFGAFAGFWLLVVNHLFLVHTVSQVSLQR